MGRPKKNPAESEPGIESAKKPGSAPKKYVVLTLDTPATSWAVLPGVYDSLDAAIASVSEIGTYWFVPEQIPGKTLLTASKVETISLS